MATKSVCVPYTAAGIGSLKAFIKWVILHKKGFSDKKRKYLLRKLSVKYTTTLNKAKNMKDMMALKGMLVDVAEKLGGQRSFEVYCRRGGCFGKASKK